MATLLGCIADDYTGATDLANTLVKSGLRTIQTIGVPAEPVTDAEAVVVALKSRTIAPEEAVRQSLEALAWLQSQGARQIFFKYCSTFDSTPKGNIGPVTDALLAALGADFTIACPAFPGAGRTIYKGYLFVGDQLLSDSPLKDHPLTPMTDANLVRVLDPQTRYEVGLVQHAEVSQGAAAIQQGYSREKTAGKTIAIVDAISDSDLIEIGHASKDLKLLTGGSGLALGLADNFRALPGVELPDAANALPRITGPEVVLSGSCSAATRGQVQRFLTDHPGFKLDPLKLAAGEDQADEALEWAEACLGKEPFLVYATAEPEEVRAAQAEIGREKAGELVEEALARVAEMLAAQGARRFVVAGGETSGAVVNALKVEALRIGQEISPGVPATVSLGEPAYALALKSGNFGDESFFARALKEMP